MARRAVWLERPRYAVTTRSAPASSGEIETDVVEGTVDDIQRCLWTLRLLCTVAGSPDVTQ